MHVLAQRAGNFFSAVRGCPRSCARTAPWFRGQTTRFVGTGGGEYCENSTAELGGAVPGHGGGEYCENSTAEPGGVVPGHGGGSTARIRPRNQGAVLAQDRGGGVRLREVFGVHALCSRVCQVRVSKHDLV